MRTWIIGLGLAAALAGTGCISSRCLRDVDCPGGQVCRELTGTCAAPECSADADCGHGRVCEDRFCVAGCASPDDCEADEQCVDRRCLPLGAECDCPMAHEFCGTDINPSSPTAGTEICVADDFPHGVGLFFGSVKCSHCTGDFAALKRRQAELAAEGLDPRMLWVQLLTVPVTPEEVGARLGPEVTDPVILDTEEAGLWEAYGVSWYHFVLIDSHGCFLSDHGPLEPYLVDGEEGDIIVREWRDAMDDDCPDGTPPLDGGDAGTDATDAGADDAVTDVLGDTGPEIVTETADEAAPETVAEATEDTTSEAAGETAEDAP